MFLMLYVVKGTRYIAGEIGLLVYTHTQYCLAEGKLFLHSADNFVNTYAQHCRSLKRTYKSIILVSILTNIPKNRIVSIASREQS